MRRFRAESAEVTGAPAIAGTDMRKGPALSNGTKDRIKLSLEVSTEINETLEELAKTTATTKSDVLRKAIALMRLAVKAQREGKKVGIADATQELRTEFVGLL